MQVRQVPFLQELGKRMPASCAEASNDSASDASNLQPCGSITIEKNGSLLRIHSEWLESDIAEFLLFLLHESIPSS
jgi:hypothetical protein